MNLNTICNLIDQNGLPLRNKLTISHYLSISKRISTRYSWQMISICFKSVRIKLMKKKLLLLKCRKGKKTYIRKSYKNGNNNLIDGIIINKSWYSPKRFWSSF